MQKDWLKRRFTEARVARLATADAGGRPHVVPVCFVYERGVFYVPLDRKPKRIAAERLVRVRNIRANRNVALLIDEYGEDWNKLWYVLVRGAAEIIASAGQKRVHGLLKTKYPPYARGLLAENALLIRITPQRIIPWSALGTARRRI
jgi:PPOX class probable F420-dependent enzyme